MKEPGIDNMMSNRPSMRKFVEFIEYGDDKDINTMHPKMDDDETLEFTIKGLEVAFTNTHPIDTNAKIYITTKRIILQLTNNSSYDFDPQYIMLHAITRDSSSYPKPCLYCQLDYDDCDDYEGVCDNDDADADDDNNVEEEDNNDNEQTKRSKTIANDDDDEPKGELYIVPIDDNDLISLFDAFSRVALLNPDNGNDDDDDDDDDDNGLIYNVDEVKLGAVQARNLAHIESVFRAPEDTVVVDGQFEDI